MKNPSSTKLSELAYLVILSLLAVFLLLAIASLWQKAIPHQRLLLAVLLFGLGYLACLYLSKLIFSPLGRLISRTVNPVRDKSLNGVRGKETAQAGSSLRELMEDLQLSREEAKRWNRELEKMASSIAHEIRNPLAVMATASGYLKRVAPRSAAKHTAKGSAVRQYPLGARDNQVGNPSVDSGRREARPERTPPEAVPVAVAAPLGAVPLRWSSTGQRPVGSERVATSHKPLDANESSQVEEQLGIIDREIERVSKIVDGLLRFSRVSTSPSHPRLVNINEMVEEALSQLSQGGGLEGIEVVKEWTSSLPRVKIDPAELQQAFLNIIQNAVQAMPNGGNLTIATKPAGETNCLEISFADTGCGIAPENMEKVFQPFFTSKDFGEGTGLGLAIAEGIVKRAGGEIKAESKLGKGTVFTVYLPLNT
ncbi:ATP-binding protein [candidate division NPL-UPA2 bacterium]|nr:ATP-binding protein [candidate division NPL-UPA2 bacterium]